jgi:hypothetical protein
VQETLSCCSCSLCPSFPPSGDPLVPKLSSKRHFGSGSRVAAGDFDFKLHICHACPPARHLQISCLPAHNRLPQPPYNRPQQQTSQAPTTMANNSGKGSDKQPDQTDKNDENDQNDQSDWNDKNAKSNKKGNAGKTSNKESPRYSKPRYLVRWKHSKFRSHSKSSQRLLR